MELAGHVKAAPHLDAGRQVMHTYYYFIKWSDE
jgi:hypothetical protein